jgi:hypothetical protein
MDNKERKARKHEQERRVRVAERAQRILEDELFKTAVQTLRDKALKEFTGASAGDTPKLIHARVLYGVTEEFINEFTKIINEGVIATSRIADLEEGNKK